MTSHEQLQYTICMHTHFRHIYYNHSVHTLAHKGHSPAVEGFYAEINGIKQILVSLEAEIFADQHIQNPLKSASGKSC